MISANLAKDPTERCRDARELGRALVQAANESGLSANDLVLRSTLLGGVRGALQLESMERTKALNLTPELARKMAGGTEVIEPSASEEQRGSSPPTSVPPTSGVEPTLADEPVSSEVLSSPRASAPPTEARTSVPPGLGQHTDSLPAIPIGAEGGGLKRALVIGAFFVIGAAISVLVARGLGAFEDRSELTVASYESRARAALAAKAWDSPPGENVRDITDAALQRWPEASEILAVRRDAAENLAAAAFTVAQQGDTEKATRLARLAATLDPDNENARNVLRDLVSDVAELDTAPAASNEAPRRKAGPGRSPRRGGRPGALVPEPAPATPDAGGIEAPAPAQSGGGRWL